MTKRWFLRLAYFCALLGYPLQAQTVPNTLKYSISAPVGGGGQISARLGSTVAVDGIYAVAGVPRDDTGGTDSGLVKVFHSTTGALLYVLPNPSPSVNAFFGFTVGISGSKVVVGTETGLAYVYDLSSATPTVPTTILSDPQPSFLRSFGGAVAISGTRVAVGVPLDDTGGSLTGCAYIFDLASATPTVPVAVFHNPTPGPSDNFGNAVAISGTRVAVGAYKDNAEYGNAYVYDLASGTPTVPVATLSNPSSSSSPHYGSSVGIFGTRVVVGAPDDGTGVAGAGSAYVFDLTSSTPSVPVTTMHNPTPGSYDNFGLSVAISGSRVVVGAFKDDTGATDAGITYVYDVAGATPNVPLYTINNPTPATTDYFGFAVSISGTRMLVGAYQDDTGALNAGSAYLYELSGGTPTSPIATLNSPGVSAGDHFGAAVAVSGTRMVVGAPFDDGGADDAGRAYVYDLASATPTVPVLVLANPSPAGDDRFGAAVGISGTRIVVGTFKDDTGAMDSGRAYVFDLSSGTPTVPVAILNNPSPVASDNFGVAVAISGTRVVVGAEGDDTGASNAGSAYVYDLTSGTPTVPVATLNNPGPAASEKFGHSVAIDGARVVVAAPGHDMGAGIVYAYNMTSGTPTVPAVTLTNRAPNTNENFGWSISISGSLVAVGTPFDSAGAINFAGTVYVFDLNKTLPTSPLATLTNPSPVYDDEFGYAVSISGTRVIVGTYKNDTGATDSGCAYFYDISSGTPTEAVAILNNPGPEQGDAFGLAVAIDGTTVVIGTPFDDSYIADKGAVYVFAPPPPDNTAPTSGTLTLNTPSPVNLSAALMVTFGGWKDLSQPLYYSVLVDDVIVSAPATIGARGFTGPATAGTHILKGRITDAVGNTAEVTQNFVVLTAQESWRKGYFGITTNTGTAADTADPDGDGENNLFEFVAGLSPKNAASSFQMRVDPVAAQPGQKAIRFGPLVAGRTYIVKSKASLSDPTWTALASFTTSDSAGERTVTDLVAGPAQKFYRVEITLP